MPGRDAPPPPGVKLTYDDFVHFPDDGRRHELIDGEHYVTPSPNRKHQSVAGSLYALLWNHLRGNPIGEVFIAPFDVVLSNFDVVEPDILYVSHARRGVLTEANVRGAPDLVVEVGSPSTRRRDEREKHRLYERSNVAEYWVVDPDLDLIKVYRLEDDRYALVQELSGERDEVLTTPLLPGLEIPLAVVFRS